MDNKTLTMTPRSNGPATPRPASLSIQSDTAFTEVAKGLAGRDLTSIADLSASELAAILELAHAVKSNPEDFRHALDAKQMVMFFEKASLRTRLTFEAAINTLGGNAVFVDQTKEPLGERESIPDVARNIERWMQVIVLRTYAHETITEMAEHANVPVINALSDLEHPCQAITDFMTLEERFGSLEGLRFTYVGDGNNVCHSLMLTGALLGTHTTIATPRGFEPKLEIIHKAIEIAETTGGTLSLMHDAQKAAEEADAIYTDVCTSMGQEHEAARRAPIFKPFQVNGEQLMSRAQESAVSSCIVSQLTAAQRLPTQVLDGPQSVVFDQAENRMHAQKAITLMLLGGAKRIPSNRNKISSRNRR